MKHLVMVFLAVVAVTAEPPRPVYSSKYAAVSIQGPQQAQVHAYRPLGVQFARQEVPQVYYIPPDQQSGPQNRTTEAEDENATTEQTFTAENSTEPESEQIKDVEKNPSSGKLTEGEEESVSQRGSYYIYHPSGLLQRIVYSTQNDVQNMGFTARLRYQDVEPIRDPIYTYDPNTLVLQPVQI